MDKPKINIRSAVKRQISRDRWQMGGSVCDGANLVTGSLMLTLGVVTASILQQVAGAGLLSWGIVGIVSAYRRIGRKYDGIVVAVEKSNE